MREASDSEGRGGGEDSSGSCDGDGDADAVAAAPCCLLSSARSAVMAVWALRSTSCCARLSRCLNAGLLRQDTRGPADEDEDDDASNEREKKGGWRRASCFGASSSAGRLCPTVARCKPL
jgi:hypothetical protein